MVYEPANQLLWHTNSDFYDIRILTFTPYELLVLGVGVVFDILINKGFGLFFFVPQPWGHLPYGNNAEGPV